MQTVIEMSEFLLRINIPEKWEKSSMTVKKYLKPPYNLFRKGLQTLVSINSNTSLDMSSTTFGTLCLDFDTVPG
jgi:hypothetical protein